MSSGKIKIYGTSVAVILGAALIATAANPTGSASPSDAGFIYEQRTLENGEAPITLHLAYRQVPIPRHPVILMLGSVETNRLPAWSTNLVREGYLLAAFTAAHPPDLDPKRRPVWLYFDERFAHSYALGGARAIADTKRVVDYLATRDDVLPDKIGWLGSSSTAIPGLAVVTQGPRLAAFVGFVCTGAYEQWFETWHEHALWRGGTNGIWPETRALLQLHDPIRHATNAFPTAVLLVSGGADKVVDPKTARAFVEAARPAYQSDPDRLRLVVYDGFGHNLPGDVVQQYAEHWFRLYLNPTSAPPVSAAPTTNLAQSVVRSQVNTADHRDLIGARSADSNALPWIAVSKSGRGVVEIPSGNQFTPWGFNYDRDYKMRLLEDYWETEWQTVTEDFHEMKHLGANVIRVHLQLAKFMDAPDKPNAPAFERLSELLRLAEQTGLYLDVTGLACYRKSDVPTWYDSLDETARWRVQARFWSAVATRCASSPAVFCYDLMNEPVSPGAARQPGDWLLGQLAGFYYVQAITLDPAGRAPAKIARKWAAQLVAAIREQDTKHLITAGLLPNSGADFVQEISKELDLVCVHIYPKAGQIENSLRTLKNFSVGKPLVIEEIFPLHCDATDLGAFIEQSKPLADGWIGFYWGQSPAELKKSASVGEVWMQKWLELFQQMNPNQQVGGRQ